MDGEKTGNFERQNEWDQTPNQTFGLNYSPAAEAEITV